jgi:hypothetical protein
MKPSPLADELNGLAPGLRAAQKLLFFSDFDGTPVPINNRPTACFLEPTGVLPEGITVCVGKKHDALAKYHVRDHRKVHAFMVCLLELRRSMSDGF